MYARAVVSTSAFTATALEPWRLMVTPPPMKVSTFDRLTTSAIAPFAETPPTANAPAPTTGLAFSLEETLMSEVFEMFAVPVMEDSTVAPNTVAAMDAPTATPPPEAVTVAASTFG